MGKIIPLFILPLNINVVNSQNNFTINKELPPLEIVYTELFKIISEAKHLISKFDSSYSKGDEIISIKSDDTKQTFQNINDITVIKFPVAKSFSYQSSNNRGTISKLHLDFYEYRREITIVGQECVELETIMNFLEKNLMHNRKLFGGGMFRTLFGFSYLIVVLLINYGVRFRYVGDGKVSIISKKNDTTTNLLLLVLVGIWLLFMLDIFELKDIFPGFRVLKEDINFFKKYSNYFTFWGFVLALLSFPFYRFISKTKIDSNT